jgi:hypothetical protein
MIGMKMMIAGMASMKSPTMMNRPTSSSMISIGSLCATPAIQADTTGRAAQVGEHPAESGGGGDRDQRDGVEQSRHRHVVRQAPEVAAVHRRMQIAMM